MVNTNLDTTPLPPNNLVAKDPQSAELAGYVRTKTFGRDVRESIARSIELNSTRSKSAEILANETVNVANDLTERFNAQIGALTEDSEVIDARGGKATLGQRLDETDAQLVDSRKQITEFKANAISDGAINEVIETALTYTDNPNFRYGNSHTLYDDGQMVNGLYEIDCSSFMWACFEGVTYQNSKYLNDKNYPSENGFVIPDQYIYNNRGSDRALANDWAEYAYRNGWLYKCKPDYSNVQVGDVLFWENSYDYGFFKNIGHNQIVVGKSRKGILNLVHASETTPAVQFTTFSISQLQQNKVLWGARFPLKGGGHKPEILNFDPFKRFTSTGSHLGKVTLKERIEENQVYTIFIKAELNSNLSYPTIQTGDNKPAFSFYDIEPRPDGVWQGTFVIRKGELNNSLDTQNLNVLVTNQPGGTIDYFVIYKGYVSQLDENSFEDSLVYERGENENGSYVKYIDGTLICRMTKQHTNTVDKPTGALFKSDPEQWTYPVPFKERPYVSGHTVYDNHWLTYPFSPTETKIDFVIIATTSSENKGSVFLTAEGRWR